MNWRTERARVVERLAAAGIEAAEVHARFLVEEASGYAFDEWLEIAESEPAPLARTRLWAMVERDAAGEPLQYVLGSWSFRGLDLMVDRRVLIPRPETETVVEVALEEAVRLGLRRGRAAVAFETPAARAMVADLGTGSGAIALAIEAELPDVEVWATDASEDALAVARANVAGCAATRVRIAPAGSWFDALPPRLRGSFILVVSNPPYVAAGEVAALPRAVAGHEPIAALVPGERGTEALEVLLEQAPEWLTPGGSLVLELAPHQALAMSEHARALGYTEAVVRADLAGRARVLVARTG
jgi:release factor glutamine methyltransferase